MERAATETADLPRMTAEQSAKANALIRELCANFDDGCCYKQALFPLSFRVLFPALTCGANFAVFYSIGCPCYGLAADTAAPTGQLLYNLPIQLPVRGQDGGAEKPSETTVPQGVQDPVR